MSFHRRNQERNQLSENISASEKLMDDDFNIKSHLNTSLELKGINVSEELINKTLNAVKKDMEEQPLTRTVNPRETNGISTSAGAADLAGSSKQTGAGKAAGTNKPVGTGKAAWFRSTRILAGTAAALIVFAVGLGVISNFGKYSPKYDMDSTRSMVAEDKATESATASDTSSATSSGTDGATNGEAAYSVEQPADQTFEMADAADTGTGENLKESDQSKADTDTSGSKASAKASSAESDTKTVVSEDKEVAKAAPKLSAAFRAKEAPVTDIPKDTQIAEPDESQEALRGLTSSLPQEKSLSFSDIIPVTLEEISSVKITDLIGNRAVTLTLQEEIQNFYSAMEEQKLVKSTLAPTLINNYTIEITNMQGTLFSVTIGNLITVNSTSENITDQSFYITLDSAELQKVIEGYFK